MIASVRFLIDADLPRSIKTLLEKFGHEAIDVRDIGLRSAKDQVIARYAQDHQACLLTGDFGFADIRNYPPETFYGIVVPGLPRDATGANESGRAHVRNIRPNTHFPALGLASGRKRE